MSQNPLEDKGINALSTTLSQRKYPLKSICFQSCSITHKSLYAFHTGLTTNPMILKHLQILNLTGNRIKEENCLTLLFSNPENVLEELQLSDVEFPLESVRVLFSFSSFISLIQLFSLVFSFVGNIVV